ncbi:Na+/H+ antiporter NhaA [Bradyrhizobium frederickii]|uniref:Na+/H+ antiporter NhaA n=1 Tax=Bradyrhizobium frederickii TaxID=2560054 RepID=UPI003D323212
MEKPSFSENLPRSQRLAEQALTTLQGFLHVEAVSGGVLLVAAVFALACANSPLARDYHAFWNLPLTIGVGEFLFSKSLHFWVNDGLMTIFFLVVGWRFGAKSMKASGIPIRRTAGRDLSRSRLQTTSRQLFHARGRCLAQGASDQPRRCGPGARTCRAGGRDCIIFGCMERRAFTTPPTTGHTLAR